MAMATGREVQRSRSAQVGFLMRAYRESFTRDDGRRGLTQEELLSRMGSVDGEYAQRFSHATVSRWESGATRPRVDRLRVFGKALDLPETEVAGMVLLAGLAPDFRSALMQVDLSQETGSGRDMGNLDEDFPDAGANGPESVEERASVLRSVAGFVIGRCVLPGLWVVVLGYVLSLLGWNGSWMPVVYAALVAAVVLAQGFVKPDRGAGLREFFWVSVFFLLTTPLLQFAPIQMDHYNFYAIDEVAGTQIPWMLALLLNLFLASLAGLMFDLLARWQYPGDGQPGSAIRRATLVVLPPVAVVYGVVVVITNLSVSIQLAVLLPVLAAVLVGLLVLKDPAVKPTERDRRMLFPALMTTATVSTFLGIVTILAVYFSPDVPAVLPDHNLVTSWELDFDELGYSREAALDMVNLGYMWHAMCVLVYMGIRGWGSLDCGNLPHGGRWDRWRRIRTARKGTGGAHIAVAQGAVIPSTGPAWC